MHLLFSLVLFFSPWLGKPPEKEVDCKQLVINAYRKLAAYPTPKAGQVLHVQLNTVTMYQKDGPQKGQKLPAKMELYSNGAQNHLLLPDVELFQDEHTIVSILKKHKQIMLTQNRQRDQRLGQMVPFRDTLFNYCQVVECTPMKGSGLTKVVMQLRGKAAGQTSIQQMSFWVDVAQEQIRKLQISYDQHYAVSQVEMEITTWEWLKKYPALNKAPASWVLDTRGQLLPAYQGYQLIDQRTSAK